MKRGVDKAIKDRLAKNHLCFVLLTCNSKQDGNIEAELTYDGDPVLASYMLQNAQSIIDENTFAD